MFTFAGRSFRTLMRASREMAAGGPTQQCIGDHGRGRLCVGLSVLTVQLITMTYFGTLGLLFLCVALVKSNMEDDDNKGEYDMKG